MPRNFDIAQPSARYAFVEETVGRQEVLPRSTFVKSRVISFLAAAQREGRSVRVVDFRAGRELALDSDGKLADTGRFDPAPPGEVLFLGSI